MTVVTLPAQAKKTTSSLTSKVRKTPCSLSSNDASTVLQEGLHTKDGTVQVTPSNSKPPAHQADDPRSATDLEDSRLDTPRAHHDISSVSSEACCVMKMDCEPILPLAPAGIPLFRRSPRLSSLADTPMITPEKTRLPRGPRTAPAGPSRRASQPLKKPANLDKFLDENKERILIRKLSSAPQLMKTAEAAEAESSRPPSRREKPVQNGAQPARQAIASQPLVILDPPLQGLPFKGMTVCDDERIPTVNAESATYFQSSYLADDLPAERLDKFARTDCLEGQLQAREEGSMKRFAPNQDGPTTGDIARLTEHQVGFCEDIESITPSGEKFFTNDSQRLCMQVRCSYLSLTKLERMDGKPSLLVYPFCSRFCQLQFSNDCLRLARTTAEKRRFLFPHATHEKRNSARVWLNHKRRFAMEQKERECIANAFESYSNWQGSQNAEEVKQLAGGNPSDFAKDPKWPTYSERTMKGPIMVETINEDLKHETGLRPSSLQRCASPPDNPQAVDEQVTAVQGSLDHTADSDIARAEAADTADKAREHLALNHVELLHAWAESVDEGQKSYNSSKFQKKEKSRGKLQRQEKEPVSKFPRAKKNATLHPNLTEEKHYNARTKELIAEGRLTAYDSPYEQKVCKIVRIENHHENERDRIFLYSLTGDSANPHYLSLSKAMQLNESMVLSYLYANKLTDHPEVQKLGIDAKIRERENLVLEPLPRTQSGIPSQEKSTVSLKNPGHGINTSATKLGHLINNSDPENRGTEGKPTGVRIEQSSAFHRPEPAADMAGELPPEAAIMAGESPPEQLDIPAQNIDQSEMREMLPQEVRVYCNAWDPNPFGSKKQVARQTIPGRGISTLPVRRYAIPDDAESSDESGSEIGPPEGAISYPDTDRVVTYEDREHWKRKRRGLFRTAFNNGKTRQTSAEIRESERARSAKRSHPKEDDSRDGKRGKSKQSSSHHSNRSIHHHASQDAASSDSDEEGQKPRDYTDEHQDDAKGKGAITSDTDDYESPPVISGSQERATETGSTDSEGSYSDSESNSDDSSSESDLDVRASQRKALGRSRALKRGKHLKAHRRDRTSRSESPAGRSSRIESRSRSPESRERSRSPKRSKPLPKERHGEDPSWKSEFRKWTRSDRIEKKHETDHKRSPSKKRKKSRRTRTESLSALSTVEHVHLGMLVSDLAASSDDESDEMDYEELILESPTEVTLAAGSASSSSEDPPQEFFDDLLARPEHVARINESGLSRATYLDKVVKAPTAAIGELFYDLSKKRHIDKEREKIPRSLQYPERLTANAQFRPGNHSADTLVWKKNFMSECTWVKEQYLTPLCLRSALDPKVSAAVRSNFSREKFKGKYEAERSDLIPFEDICIFLKKTYDRPGRLEHALLDYLTLSQGKGTVRDLITTRTNKLGILSRLGAEALPEDLDRALILRALSAPLSEYIASRHNHLKYSVDEILRICKTRELAVNNASRSSRNESLNVISKRGNRKFSNPRTKSSNRFKNKGHLNAAVFKKKRVTSRRPNKASLFAFGNDSEQPRVSTRLFRTNYSDAEWNVRVGPDGKIKPGVNPKDPRHRNSFNKDTVNGKPWCLICKKAGHDMTSCRTPPRNGGKGKGKGQGGQRGRGQGRGQNNFRR